MNTLAAIKRRRRYNASLLSEGLCVHCADRPRAVAANGAVLQHCESCRAEMLDRANLRNERLRRQREAARDLALAALRSPDARIAELAAEYLELIEK